MPEETAEAIVWAMQQTFDGAPVTIQTHHELAHMVRKYFNQHEIQYPAFSWTDLEPHLPQQSATV